MTSGPAEENPLIIQHSTTSTGTDKKKTKLSNQSSEEDMEDDSGTDSDISDAPAGWKETEDVPQQS